MKVMNPSCVTIFRKGKEDFGVVLRPAYQGSGSVLERVVKGSAAADCCRCYIGDRILSVNNINVLFVDFRIAAFFIEHSDNSVTLMFWPFCLSHFLQGEERFVKLELREEVRFYLAGGSGNMPLFVRANCNKSMKNDTLLVGDIIEEINDETTKNMTRDHAMKFCEQPVTLLVKRGMFKDLNSDYWARVMHSVFPYSITVPRQRGDFGFIIKPYCNELGSILANVVAGSPAQRCGRCHIGDRILAVNDVNVFHMDFRFLFYLMHKDGISVTLTFCPSYDGTGMTPTTSQTQELFREFMLYKSLVRSFDICGSKERNLPIYVSALFIDKDDYERDTILVGDQILEVNGKTTKNMTIFEVRDLVR